ncbi:MAG: ATP-binding protein [Bacteroidia bacterium]
MQNPNNTQHATPWYRSIRTKLFAAFSALVVAIAAFSYLYFPSQFEQQALTGARDQAQSLADFLAFSLSPAVDFDDSLSAVESMVAARQNQEITWVVVTGKRGQRFVGFGDDEAGRSGYTSAAKGQVSEDKRHWLTWAPIQRQEVEIGKVHLGFSLAKIKEAVSRSQQLIALICLVWIVLGVGFVSWITTLVTRNLSRIMVAVEGVREGDLSVRAEVSTADEVGILARTFNDMAGQLQESTITLQRSEAQFRNLAQSMNEGLLQLSGDLIIRYVNPRLCQMISANEDQLLGKHLSVITGNAPLPEFHEGSETQQQELQITTPNQEARWILMSYSYGVTNAAEQSITMIFTDITHLKKTERDLTYKNRELDTFVYKASHDLKAPLSSLRGLVDIAKEEISAPEAGQYLGLIDRTIAKMDDVLMGLLEVTWIKQGAMDPQVIYMRDLVQTILRSIENAPGFHTVRIDLDIPEHCTLVSDLKMLNSVVQNLVHNAIKYHRETGDDKWVRIGISETPKSLRISIRDNGPGIPANVHDKLFDMFFRASTKSKGSGLGLYIVKNSIEKMGGTITLTSEVGVGSEFLVELPKRELPVLEPDVVAQPALGQ